MEKPIHIPDGLIVALEERVPHLPLDRQAEWSERKIWWYAGQRAIIECLKEWKQEQEKPEDVSSEA